MEKVKYDMKMKPMPKGQYKGDNDVAGKQFVDRAKKNTLNKDLVNC